MGSLFVEGVLVTDNSSKRKGKIRRRTGEKDKVINIELILTRPLLPSFHACKLKMYGGCLKKLNFSNR
jgi:hypothetical protein